MVVFGRMLAQRLDDPDELPRPAVRQIIAVDRGDDDMLEAERPGGFGDVLRLQRVDRPRHAGLDVAEGAGPRAGIAQDHHRGVLLAPAFADVGAGRFLADGVEVQPPHQRARLGKGLPRSARARAASRACGPGRGQSSGWAASVMRRR